MKFKDINLKKKKDYMLKYNEKKRYSINITNIKFKPLTFYYMHILLIFIIIINYFPLNISGNIKKLSTIYHISIKVKGKKGHQQKILGDTDLPDKIKINGRDVSNIKFSYDNLEPGNNLIEFFWEELPNCKNMFSGILDLKSVDLTHFDSSGCTDMTEMFSNCENLESINFGDFETSSITLMDKMFYNCKNLQTIDLSKFKTHSLTSMESMFYNADKLISLDLTNFNTSLVTNMNNMFNGCNSLIYINLNSFVENSEVTIENIFSSSIIYCINDEKSPKIYSFLKSRNLEKDCDNECFKGATKIIKQEKKCVESCDDKIYRIEKNICELKPVPQNKDTTKISLKVNEIGIDDKVKETNKNDENIIKTQNLENTETEVQFNSENFFKDSQQTHNEELSNKDEVINNLKDDIINGKLNTLLSNLINGTKQDLIAEYKDITYQITTSSNQKNGSYNNISTINLGQCEEKLKTIYNIDPKLSLIILKIDYKMDGLLIPVIGYEVYHPINKSQLDLNYCNDTTVKLNIPVSIDEDAVYKYDPNSEYYNDDCYAFTTENGTDIILNDRKNEYIDNNLSLCENNCTFNGYDENTKKAICECETKVKINMISDILLDENILSNKINNTEKSATNIGTMKCVSLLFSKNGLLKNIGSYILFLTIGLFGVSIFIFYKCGYQLIENNIQEIINSKKNIDSFELKPDEKKNRKKKRKKKIKKDIISNPKKKNNRMNNNNLIVEPHLSGSKSDFKFTNTVINNEKNKFDNITIYKNNNTIQNKGQLIKLKESELNLLSYKNALFFDKRPYGDYYCSLNKIKILLLFAFFPIDDYNIKIIKINIFFLSFVIFFSVNTFFFNDSTLHQIYLDGGKYNFSYFLPQIIYSFIISNTIIIVLKYFCLSERNLLEIKNVENPDEISDKADSVKRCLLIKYIIFYISSLVFLIVFWYYLSSFCAVYQNTQIYLAINAILSFIISCIYPLIFNLLPSFLRINALKNKHNEFLYNVSKIMQLL